MVKYAMLYHNIAWKLDDGSQIRTVSRERGSYEVISMLNLLAQDGWELVVKDGIGYLLKKEVSEND